MTTTGMSTANRADAEVSRFDSLAVEGFTLYDGKGATRHFERDPDLMMKVREARGETGDQRATVVISLGLDGHDSDLVQVDYYAGAYDDGAHDAVSEAIEALEVIRQQLGVMASTPIARQSEHNAFLLGTEAERAGLPIKERP